MAKSNGPGRKGGPNRSDAIRAELAANPKATSRESEVFLIDNTHPFFEDVQWKRDGKAVHVTGTLADATSDVVRLEASVDGGDWSDHPPADGIFDARSECIEVRVEVEGEKEHSILLRGMDLAGNLSATRVLVLTTAPRLAGVLLAVATWIKVWPAALIAAAFVALRTRWRIAAGAAIASAVIATTALLLGAGTNLFSFIGQQAGRGLQVESPIATF